MVEVAVVAAEVSSTNLLFISIELYFVLRWWCWWKKSECRTTSSPRYVNPFLSIIESRSIYFPGVFIARAKDDDMLLTKNLVSGESVYGEKRISVDV